MMKFYNFSLLFLAFFALSSCSKEENNLHPLKDQYIQNDGYLPLAPDNTWVYETWLADLQKDGTHKYNGSAIPTETAVTAIDIDDVNNKISYRFSPLNIPLIGDLLGNFNKVTKLNGKYYRNAKVKTSTTPGSGIEFDLDGSLFLDDEVKVGDMIYSNAQSFTSGFITPINVKYKHRTYVTGKYDKLPAYLTSSPGIDDHLAEYTDIVKVTDSLTIEQLELNLNSIQLDVDLSIEIEPSLITIDSLIIDLSTPTEGLTGKIAGELAARLNMLLPLPLVNVPIILNNFKLPLGGTGLPITIQASAALALCGSKSNISVKEIFNYKYDLISNDTPIYIDSYYAKGVGKIKSIINIDQLKASIGLNANDENGLLEIKTTAEALDPTCYDKPASITLRINPNVILKGLNITVPLVAGVTSDLIQNLRYHVVRKSLN